MISLEERAKACGATDWQRYGENDGRLGVATAERAYEFDRCAAAGVPVDLAAYQTGRAAGLPTYCTAETGYTVGYEGRGYSGVCPAALEADFLQGYERGKAERPAVVVRPSFGIGIGTGGVRSRVGIGISLGGFYGPYRGHRRCHRRYCW
ncbi:MAG: DUF2799 domain-containing protein [Pseudomonadota bacterium]